MNELREPQFTIRIGDLRATEGQQGHRVEIMHLNTGGGTSGYVVAWIDGKDGDYDIHSVGMRAFDNQHMGVGRFPAFVSLVFGVLTEIDRLAREG